MSEREEFLVRWSRRKRQRIETVAADKVEEAPSSAKPRAPEGTADDDKSLDQKAPLPEPGELLFDPATLPSIESITAETDIRAFLAPGVPAELTRAALRRVWVADPKIRDFVGLAECSWDFNAPGAVPGFGPLEMTDEWRREIVGMLTRSQPQELAENSTAAVPEVAESTSSGSVFDQRFAPAEPTLQQEIAVDGDGEDKALANNESVLCSKENIAVQNQPTQQPASQFIVQRSHGGALPKS